MSGKIYPSITVVNDEDEVVGYFQLFDAIAQGFRRRISVIFIFNSAGHILIQRRAAHILSPNLLDFSAAGHVNEGDDYLKSAQSELYEELGIKDVDLQLVKQPFKVLDMYVAVFRAVVSDQTVICMNSEEVAGVHWVALPELNELILRHPKQFTESFITAWPLVCDKIKA